MTTVVDAPTRDLVATSCRVGTDRWVDVTCEPTPAAGLVIGPRIHACGGERGPVEFQGGFTLLHVASGVRVQTVATAAPALRRIAARVAHLDWTAPDTGQYGVEGSPWRAAVHNAEAEAGR